MRGRSVTVARVTESFLVSNGLCKAGDHRRVLHSVYISGAAKMVRNARDSVYTFRISVMFLHIYICYV